MKGKAKRALSGVLSLLTILTSVIQPMFITYAAEPAGYEAQYPALETVREFLHMEEVVTAEDYEVEAGSGFDVESDFSGLEINDEKVRVTFHEAKNEAGQDYDGNHADTYKAVYFVEPVSGHPSYHVCRNIIVKEPVKERQTESHFDGGGTGEESTEAESEDEDSEQQPQTELETENVTELPKEAEILSEEDLDAALEESEGQKTVDEESGLTLGEVLLQAEDQGIDIQGLKNGESVSFMAQAPMARAARASQSVTITQGDWYYYADYGLGSYLTAPFTVTFGNVTATAFCIQPSKPGPGSGTYQITKLEGNRELAKVCYYGTEASGSAYFFNHYHNDFSAGKRFIVTHLAASYANGSGDAFYGTNSTGETLAKELYNYAVGQPDIPDVEMSFSNANVTAYVADDQQRTEEITFKASSQQTITLDLPDGVKLHNVSTGKSSAAGAKVTISGGTSFYLTAPLTQTKDVSGSWSAKMQGSITKDYSAYKITTGSDTQDLALVFGEGVEDEKYVSLSVKWLELAKVEVIKVDSNHSDAKLAGAVFGIYSDKDCTKLITKMPATDKNGSSVAEIIKTQDTVYLKEITAPTGYRLNTSSYNVNLVGNQITSVTVPDQEQLGELTVYKEGQVLTGADVTEEGVTFRYENRRQEGAVYNVYAGADIVTAYGAKVYSKGDLVKANLTTDSNGATVLKNLHLGTYTIKEVQAPENFYNAGEEKTVTLSYAGQNVETVFSESTFVNDRQKADVTVLKKDKDTLNPLDGGMFGLYAGSDIINADGSVVVSKGTLIEKAVTGEDGKAVFTADLPIGFSYTVKETSPAPGFATTDEIQEFTFTAESSEKATVSYEFTFEDEPTVFEFTKTSLTTGEEIEGAKLTVTDENGKVVDEWVSGKEPHIIKELVVGQTYTMTEILPALGYVTAESIRFTVKDTAEVQKIEMKDDVTKVEISKTDIAGEELPGAKLTIWDENGEVVESWTSTEEPHYIEMLPIGKYTLHEEAAPEGYLVAEDVAFEVKDTSEIQKVVMKDEAEPEETPKTPETSTTTVDMPKTGDSTPIAALMISCVLGLAGTIAAAVRMKMRKKK